MSPAPAIRTLYDGEMDPHGGRELHLEVMHPNGQQGAVLYLERRGHYPAGHWHINDVEPIDHTQHIPGDAYHRNFANRLGPAVLRHVVHHLKTAYGVKTVDGFRITGARQRRWGDDVDTHARVDVAFKALHFEEVVHRPGKEIEVHATPQDNPNCTVRINISRYPQEQKPEGTWWVQNIESVDRSPHTINTFGPRHVRELFTHLRVHYGVQRLEGGRSSGARARAQKKDRSIAMDLIKALVITEVHRDAGNILLTAHHADDPSVGVRVGLSHGDHHPEGVWHVDGIMPAKKGASWEESAGRFGAHHIRELARHVRDTYGVKLLYGMRTSGSKMSNEAADKTARVAL